MRKATNEEGAWYECCHAECTAIGTMTPVLSVIASSHERQFSMKSMYLVYPLCPMHEDYADLEVVMTEGAFNYMKVASIHQAGMTPSLITPQNVRIDLIAVECAPWFGMTVEYGSDQNRKTGPRPREEKP